MNHKNLVILGICISLALCSAGCVTAGKNLLKPAPTPVPIPTWNLTTPTPTPVPTILYVENQDEYMFRTGGHYLGDWVQYKRDNVEGLKDLDLRATVYRSVFLPHLTEWWISWGNYFPRYPSEGMKYLVVFAHVEMEGTTQENDPRIWGPGQDHFVVQVRNMTYLPINEMLTGNNESYLIGTRIRELDDYYDLNNVSRIYNYGYFRYFGLNGWEQTGEQGYIRMGKTNGFDGFLLFEIPKETKMDDIKVLERIDGIGNVWWYLKYKPKSLN
jgi:hypothetical protein